MAQVYGGRSLFNKLLFYLLVVETGKIKALRWMFKLDLGGSMKFVSENMSN